MSWNNGIRHAHRGLAVVFTLTVIVTFIALSQEQPAVWISYLPLAPLALLQLTGMYLFVLPYLAKRRGTNP